MTDPTPPADQMVDAQPCLIDMLDELAYEANTTTIGPIQWEPGYDGRVTRSEALYAAMYAMRDGGFTTPETEAPRIWSDRQRSTHYADVSVDALKVRIKAAALRDSALAPKPSLADMVRAANGLQPETPEQQTARLASGSYVGSEATAPATVTAEILTTGDGEVVVVHNDPRTTAAGDTLSFSPGAFTLTASTGDGDQEQEQEQEQAQPPATATPGPKPTLPALCRRYAALRAAQKGAEAETATIKTEADQLQAVLLEQFAEEGIPGIPITGVGMVSMRRDVYARTAAGSTPEDLHAALRAAGAAELITDTVNSSRLSAYVREFDKAGTDLPEQLQTVLSIGERYSVRVTAK